MKSKLIFSNGYVIDDYLRLIHLFLINKKKTLSSLKTSIKLKLANKRFLFRFYKKLLQLPHFSYIFHSYIIFSYCLFKRYFLSNVPWILTIGFNLPNLMFFVYHFITLYRAIFLMKMVIDWFPIKNWERSSPFKRFFRRGCLGWVRPFEEYFPSIWAWVIVVNLVPIFMSSIETFYTSYDFVRFPTKYNFVDMTEFILEANQLPLPQTIYTKLLNYLKYKLLNSLKYLKVLKA